MSRKLPVLAFVMAFFVASLQAAPLEIAGRVQVADGTVKGQAALFPARSAGEEARLRLAGKADPPLASARILPDGGFELAAPEFGLYRVLVDVEGHLPMELYAAVAGDTELPEVRPEPARLVEILVLGPEGRPAAGVPLSMSSSSWADDPSVWPTGRHASWRPADRYGVTREDGRLVLPQGVEKSRSFLQASGAPSLDVSPGERSKTLRLPVRRPHRLAVRGAGGRPLAGVLARSGRLPLAIGDDQGRIEVLAVEGEQIQLESPEGHQAWIELSNVRGGPQQATLGPPRIVRGRVLEAGSRSPLAGALVWRGGPPAVRSTGGGAFELPVRAAVSGGMFLEGAALDHVAWGQHFPEGQEPVLLLWPAAEIRGSVTEAGGRPVPGAEISAIPADAEGNRDFQREVKTRTAADGSFRLRGLFSGATYRLGVQRAGMAPAVRLAGAGAAAPVHIVLSPGARISGRILDEEGRPVAGARVIFSSTNEGDLDAWHAYLRRDPRFSRTTTDAEGRFQLVDVRAGRFHLTMDRQGFLPATRSVEVPDPPRDVDLGEVTLEAGAVLEGLVTDEQGRPLAEARVSSAPSDPASVPLERRRQRLEVGGGGGSRTGPDGRFRVESLIQGVSYDLSVELDGYVPAKVSGVEPPARAPLRIEMKPAPSLTGRVVGPDGRPVAMASVAARGEGDAAHMPPLASAGCDESGRFRLFFAAPGSVTLAARATDYRTKIVRGVEVPARGEVGPIEISLEPGAVLEGRVLDERGTPVSGAQVSAQSTGALFGVSEVWQVSNDAEGRYRLEGLDLGPYDVSATAGDRKARASVDIGLSVQSLDLRLEEQASVSGRVTDAAGAPVVGAGVFLIPADPEGERAQRVTSGADGAFVFPPVSRGTYRLIVLAEGFGVSPPEELRVDRDLAGLDLRLSPGAVVNGLVRGLSPEELPAVRIVAVREGAETRTHPLPGTFLPGTVDRDGRYRILQLGPGKWRVIASLESSQRKAEGSVEIASPGEEVELDLSF